MVKRPSDCFLSVLSAPGDGSSGVLLGCRRWNAQLNTGMAASISATSSHLHEFLFPGYGPASATARGSAPARHRAQRWHHQRGRIRYVTNFKFFPPHGAKIDQPSFSVFLWHNPHPSPPYPPLNFSPV